jgi:hypothetical protein
MTLIIENIPSPEIAELKMGCEVLSQASIYRDENNGLKKTVTFFKNSIIYGCALSYRSICSVLLTWHTFYR